MEEGGDEAKGKAAEAKRKYGREKEILSWGPLGKRNKTQTARSQPFSL